MQLSAVPVRLAINIGREPDGLYRHRFYFAFDAFLGAAYASQSLQPNVRNAPAGLATELGVSVGYVAM